mgnify:CR=1 FL=1
MKFTMRGLTRSLADQLAPFLPGVTFYDNPNQQGTKLPAMFLQRTRAKITMKMGGRFLRRLGLDLVYLVDYNQVDMDDQYTRAADILDERLETFPYSDGEGGQSAILRTYERSWSIQDDALHYKFDLNIWVSPEEDAVLMGSIQSYNEEVS